MLRCTALLFPYSVRRADSTNNGAWSCANHRKTVVLKSATHYGAVGVVTSICVPFPNPLKRNE
jgi:hypothetical protein